MNSNMDLYLSGGPGSDMIVVSAGIGGAGGSGMWKGSVASSSFLLVTAALHRMSQRFLGLLYPAHYFVLVQAFCCLVPLQDVPVPVDNIL